MDETGDERVGHAAELALLHLVHGDPAVGRLFRQIGASIGVEQRELGDTFGFPAHDFEGDVAAHGEPGEREFGRRGGQDVFGGFRDRVTPRRVRNPDVGDVRQILDLMPPQLLGAQKAGYQDER